MLLSWNIKTRTYRIMIIIDMMLPIIEIILLSFIAFILGIRTIKTKYYLNISNSSESYKYLRLYFIPKWF